MQHPKSSYPTVVHCAGHAAPRRRYCSPSRGVRGGVAPHARLVAELAQARKLRSARGAGDAGAAQTNMFCKILRSMHLRGKWHGTRTQEAILPD